MKSWSLSLLESSGPVQAFTVIDFFFFCKFNYIQEQKYLNNLVCPNIRVKYCYKILYDHTWRYAVAQLFETLRYKPEVVALQVRND